MSAADLHVFTARANPLRWRNPHKHFVDFAQHMLDSGVHLHVIECQYGDRPFECEVPGVRHVGVRAKTPAWSKENLLNELIRRTPEAKKIIWSDSDVFHRRSSWAEEAAAALDLYDVIQPWSDAYDLGPNDEHIQHHISFARQMASGQPLVPDGAKFWRFNGGPYDYPHSGYCWGITRQAFDWLGGLFELGGMGSGDHHMALSLAGYAERSVPGDTHPAYQRHVMRWQERAVRHVNFNVGYVGGTLEHRFHGRKADRGYLSRWNMFLRHQFNPDEDLKKNSFGVYEWAGNKPELRREWDLYLRSRNEDVNTLS
jgi:hypothetical protein